MATKTVTAEVDGVKKVYTLDVPDGATTVDIEDAIANYHDPAKPKLVGPPQRPGPGLQPQKGEPTAQPDWMSNLAGGLTAGAAGAMIPGAQGAAAGALGKILPPLARGAVTGATTGGLGTIFGDPHPVQHGIEAGVGAAVMGAPGISKVLKNAGPIGKLVALLFGQGEPETGAAAPGVTQQMPIAPGALPGAPSSTLSPLGNTPPISAPQTPATLIQGGSTLGALTKTPPPAPVPSRTSLADMLGIKPSATVTPPEFSGTPGAFPSGKIPGPATPIPTPPRTPIWQQAAPKAAPVSPMMQKINADPKAKAAMEKLVKMLGGQP